ncbi:NAD(P)H-binding [Duganella sp. CF458]|uniref:SDR family oxidoreductase n=1 Tax=Duganella sp. CF458 TaxID=1884368 RepID=UPI0008E2A903|nr:NAD(P)H-binding protein [Duganella sp. CF458]SFF64364.1 NAD(P)H-binding [Duganella sp. CF458]
MFMKYLVTGATGNIGSLVTHRLIKRGIRPCIFVRDTAKARALFGDAVDIRVGDSGASQLSLAAAFAGIDTLFLLNSGPDLAARDRAAARAAKTADVSHLVKLSTLDVLTGVGTGSWHAKSETAVHESGFDYTFIRSAGFMTNALYWAKAIKTERVLRS